MATKLQLISELLQQQSSEITSNVDRWKGYLNTAARLYKYSFDDQLLIHAQRPDATACAHMEQWNGKMGRWVNAGSKGIALIRKGQGNPRLEYVFDVSDTHAVRGGKSPWIWQMQEKYRTGVLERLEKTYGITPQNDFGDKLMELAARAVGESYREYLHDLKYDLDDSFLEGLDDLNIDVRFRDSVTASVQYTLLTRCGLDAAAYLADEDFEAIAEFNTPAVLSHLGSAANAVSNELLVEIGSVIKSHVSIKRYEKENLSKPIAKSNDLGYTNDRNKFNALNRERNYENGEHDLQQNGRLPDTGLSDGQDGGRAGGNTSDVDTGQIRNASGDLFDGTSKRQIHLSADDRKNMGALAGNRQDSASEGGFDDGRIDEAKRDNRSIESGRPDGMGATGQQSESTGGGNRVERTGVELNSQSQSFLQTSLFPTVEEQMESITAAKTEEKTSVFFSVQNSHKDIPQEVIDSILATGGNDENSTKLIAGYISRNTDLAENTRYLQEHYSTGGKGFGLDGVHYSLWFDKDGLQIGRGNSAKFAASKVTLSWEQVAQKVRRLLESSQYLSAENMSQAEDVYFEKLASAYNEMVRDKNDNYHNLYIDKSFYTGLYPDTVKNATAEIKNPDKLESILKGIEQMVQDHENTDGGIMRFGYYAPARVFHQLKDLKNEPIIYMADADFQAVSPSFITEDEINADLIGGSSIEEGKLRIYSFFMQGHDTKTKAKFLKDEYGIGGHGQTGVDQWHDSKGIKLSRGNPSYDTVMQNWGQVAKRVDRLIAEKRYLSAKELDYIPAYEKTVLARAVYSFYYYVSSDVVKPYTVLNNDKYRNVYGNFQAAAEEISEKLDNPEYVDGLAKQMQYVLDHTLSNERGFDSMQATFKDVTAFKNGAFSILTKKAYKEKPVELDEEDDEEEFDELAAAAKKLEHRRQKKWKETDTGQLSLDFSGTLPLENAENITADVPEKESNHTPNVTDYLRPVVEEQAELSPVIAPLDYHENTSKIDFHITDDELGYGGAKVKYDFNVAAIEQMNLPSGNVLEPACGIGNFFGLVPDSMQKSKLYGVELDSITGRIAKQLYQNADITVSGFEKTDFPDDFFDLAVGNVPFGDYKLADKRYDKSNFLIHDYFFGATRS